MNRRNNTKRLNVNLKRNASSSTQKVLEVSEPSVYLGDPEKETELLVKLREKLKQSQEDYDETERVCSSLTEKLEALTDPSLAEELSKPEPANFINVPSSSKRELIDIVTNCSSLLFEAQALAETRKTSLNTKELQKHLGETVENLRESLVSTEKRVGNLRKLNAINLKAMNRITEV